MSRSVMQAIVSSVIGLGVLTLLCACSSSAESRPRNEAEGQFTFWPLAPDEPRIQFVKAYRSGFDLKGRRQSGIENIIFGEENEDVSAIKKPYGVEIKNGRIYVCDIRRPALTVLDIAQEQVRLVGVQGANRLGNPVDVAVADDGWIYVADSERRAVVVYNPQERYSRAFNVEGWKPVSIAVHGDRLYVCDLEMQRVVILDRRSGSVLGKFGVAGDGDGEFRVPLGVDTDSDGYVYISDMMRCRTQKFTPDGSFLGGVGELGDYAGSFARPKQIAVDNDGIIYVVDAAFNNVQMFNDEFSLLMSFGAAGDFPGAMNLPVGISVTDTGLDLFADLFHPGFEPYRLIAVTNQFGPHKVAVYALGRRKDGWTVAQLHETSSAEAGVGENEALSSLQTIQDDQPASDENTPPLPPETDEEGGVE